MNNGAANTTDLSIREWLVLNALTIVFAAALTLFARSRLAGPLRNKYQKILIVALSFLRLIAFSSVLHFIERLTNPGLAHDYASRLPWHFYVLNVLCLAIAEDLFGRAFPDFAFRRALNREPESETKP